MATLSEQATDAVERNDNCTYYKKTRDYEREMVKKFSTLLYMVGIAVALSVVGLIISIAIKEYGVTAATSIGTVVTGTAVGFLIKERKGHQTESEKYEKKIADNCP
jgi:hypothetical protein